MERLAKAKKVKASVRLTFLLARRTSTVYRWLIEEEVEAVDDETTESFDPTFR